MELNERQFQLFDSSPFVVDRSEPWAQRQDDFMKSPDVQWHTSEEPMGWWGHSDVTHAGSLGAAVDRARWRSEGASDFRTAPVYPLHVPQEKMSGEVVSDARANLMSGGDVDLYEDRYFEEWLETNQRDEYDDEALDEFSDHVSEDEEDFFRNDVVVPYINTGEDPGSVSVVGEGRNMLPHGELVDEAKAYGKPVPQDVWAEREYMRGRPARLGSIMDSALANPDQFGNVGGLFAEDFKQKRLF